MPPIYRCQYSDHTRSSCVCTLSIKHLFERSAPPTGRFCSSRLLNLATAESSCQHAQVSVTNPQPAPAKQVPVSPPPVQQGDDSAAGQTPGSLPPVRRSSPGAGTPPNVERPDGEDAGADGPTQAGDQSEALQQPTANTTAASVVQLAMAPAAAPTPTTAAAGVDMLASATLRGESAVNANDCCRSDMPGAASPVVRMQALPTEVATGHESVEAANGHASAAPEDADRRASVIMMDTDERTPEVSCHPSRNMHSIARGCACRAIPACCSWPRPQEPMQSCHQHRLN